MDGVTRSTLGPRMPGDADEADLLLASDGIAILSIADAIDDCCWAEYPGFIPGMAGDEGLDAKLDAEALPGEEWVRAEKSETSPK